ncbi:hypothetical protein NRB16_24635 [Pseudomonas sp. LJDD11]|uniref:hypothetical protein n=1 Tax=unclassified Pseudomonas TaxID=196821 RepID=UPI00209757AA|nr:MULTISPECIES: hypothetical protein [unclassified Pseudomonas]MCO8160945.1 hypothetical protein [Pseudomonas sp. 21LCFQ010]MCQ9426712.1 hypothetical protein [Pseudomonas sp. LJDD11]
MPNNMRIWSCVDKTDPRYTKGAKVDGQNITSLNGTAMIMKATEMFGPVGIGFGWSVLEERFDKGGQMLSGQGDKAVEIGHELTHIIKIRFWYILEGQRGEIEQYGCTPYLYKSKFGQFTDGEAPKKSLTDAIKKSLSMLGFSADVFLGMFDDADYMKQRKAEQAIEDADDKQAERERQATERLQFLESTIETMRKATTAHELKKIHDHAVRKLMARKDEKGAARISLEWNKITTPDEGEAA